MHLTKSKYCAGMQCPKILWMDKHMPAQKAPQDETRMAAGTAVGELARGCFGDFTKVPFDGQNISGMVAETQRLLEADAKVIAEASFSFGGNFCSVDILRRLDGGYEIVEVKSASGTTDDPPEKLTQTYLDDMAYQYYVAAHCGLDIKKISLMRLNKAYTRQGALDLQQLFVLTDCTDIVQRMQAEVAENIAHIKAVALQADEPDCTIGSRCDKPYPCGYKRWCFRSLPEDNVFKIGFGMRGSKKDQAYQNGYISFEEILNSPIQLNEMQLLQVKTATENLPPHINPYGIRQSLNHLDPVKFWFSGRESHRPGYGLSFLDFETIQPAIPLWDGTRPYQQIPFQYSLHIYDRLFREPSHYEFLAEAGTDPRRALAEQLCADTAEDAEMFLAYNASFEKGRLKELAAFCPDLAEQLMRIHDNLRDLAQPFAKGHYYNRKMGGSYSIKAVLPALCGDDPELDYQKLDFIHNGGEAMAAYATLHEQPPEEAARIHDALLEYCRLDTLAMVKILEKLYEIVQRSPCGAFDFFRKQCRETVMRIV